MHINDHVLNANDISNENSLFLLFNFNLFIIIETESSNDYQQ